MAPYLHLKFPSPPDGRPWIAINMVSTIDGKIVTGTRDEPVQDLGSDVDHKAMRHIEHAADAVIIGAGVLRSTPKLWYDARLVRLVVTRSGNVDFTSRFFTDVPEKAWIISDRNDLPWPNLINLGQGSDWKGLLSKAREELGIRSLLSEGGSELNATLLHTDCVDELFLTLAPKIKLGRDVPTYAGGDPLPREQVQNYELYSFQAVHDEIFARYRRRR
ncbi:MAG: RibD family protein [Armatimonadetes bacterium]|nr:RibD family protein [Armatimonadota bacterium]